MKYFIVVILYLSLAPMPVFAASAIDVGKCDGRFYPIKWSPDGARIAFLRDGRIVVADTVGSQRVLAERIFSPRAFDWIDNSELLIYDVVSRENSSTFYEILSVQVEGGAVRSIDRFRRLTRGRRTGRQGELITLPHRTTDGLLYYTKYNSAGEAQTVLLGEQADAKGRSLSESKETVLRALSDGLYLVSLDQKDTTFVFDRPIKNSIINNSHTYVMSGGTIIRLSDGQQTILDTIITEIPDSTYGCGFGSISFSESGNFVTFVRSCDDGVNYEVSQAGLYDIDRGRLTMLSDATGPTNIKSPVISNNGRFVAFKSQESAFILRVDM
jgi:dipeptidyl aminopeptidase/acylaminoacyl peptidase